MELTEDLNFKTRDGQQMFVYFAYDHITVHTPDDPCVNPHRTPLYSACDWFGKAVEVEHI